MPTLQFPEQSEESSPSEEPCRPAVHATQSVPFWNVPSSQGVHAEAAAFETKPAGQPSQTGGCLLRFKKAPASHAEQTLEPA